MERLRGDYINMGRGRKGRGGDEGMMKQGEVER